jgi:Domain of unknown function (DUF4189)
MLKQISFLSLVIGLVIGTPQLTSPARADSAVAEDSEGNLFAYSDSIITQATAGAMALCLQRGSGGCELRGTAPNTRGWAAIAKGGDNVRWSYGRATRNDAIQSALDGCPDPNICQIVLVYLDESP